MKLYDELKARGLVALITDEEIILRTIREMCRGPSATGLS